eukprot:gene28313-37244_t
MYRTQILISLCLVCLVCLSNGFHTLPGKLYSKKNGKGEELFARRGADVNKEKPSYIVGENLPIEVSTDSAIYDMILVERISAPERTSFGLYLPKVEGKDQKHLGKVISMPVDYGLESEQGRVQPVEEILPFNLGDIVYIRDPWGIGPKNIEVGERCFSFHKAAQVTGVVKKADP